MTDRGFSLIEALVAMAVLAVAAVSLLGGTERHAIRVDEIEGRIAARWVAEYHLTALRLGLSPAPDSEMLGRAWRVETDRLATGDPGLDRIDLRVVADDGPSKDAVLALLTGFTVSETAP